MSLEIKVPTVGESITEVTIAQWLKKEGEYVEMDEVICELESDKATFELNAEQAGTLYIKAQEGETLEIGAVICEIDTEVKPNGSASEKSGSASAQKTEDKPNTPSGKTETKPADAAKSGKVLAMNVPTVGESITEVTIASWLKKDGDSVEMDEPIAEIESDKATFELTAEAQGILKIVAKEGDTLEIGAPICNIEESGPAPTGQAESKPAESGEAPEAAADGFSEKDSYATGHASPAAAKILQEKGITAKSVKGTGVDGRITKEDAMKAEAPKGQQDGKPGQGKAEATDQSQPSQPAGNRNQRRENLSSLRKTVARRLVSVKNETAMLTTFNEVDMKPIMDIRAKYKEQFKEKHEVGLGFMSFFTKAACVALKEWPAVNAMIDGEEMVFNDFCDISIAVSSPKGLVVPVIRNAETMGFDAIEKEVVRLAKKARDGKLSIDEMTGGTFTLTNGGIFGSMMSTPIINAPQSAILGMHNIVERAVVVNGEIVIRPMMYLALSYDHRVIDGRESVSFLVRLKELLQDPTRLLLGV